MCRQSHFFILPIAVAMLLLAANFRSDEQFEGTVVETFDNALTIHDFQTGEYATFIVEPKTDITLNGQRAELQDLLPFFHTLVVAQFDGQAWFAKTIDATSLRPSVDSSGASYPDAAAPTQSNN